jgi:hypothetical protein
MTTLEWEFKGEYLNVSKFSQIGAADASEDEVALSLFRHLCFLASQKFRGCGARMRRRGVLCWMFLRVPVFFLIVTLRHAPCV